VNARRARPRSSRHIVSGLLTHPRVVRMAPSAPLTPHGPSHAGIHHSLRVSCFLLTFHSQPSLLRQDLDRTLARGDGLNGEEPEPGVVAVAAPVHDHRRRVIAAVSIAGRAHRLDLERLAPAVKTAALSLSREMAARQ